MGELQHLNSRFSEVRPWYSAMRQMQKVYRLLFGHVVLLLLNVCGLTQPIVNSWLRERKTAWLLIVSAWYTVEPVLRPSNLSIASRTRTPATPRMNTHIARPNPNPNPRAKTRTRNMSLFENWT